MDRRFMMLGCVMVMRWGTRWVTRWSKGWVRDGLRKWVTKRDYEIGYERVSISCGSEQMRLLVARVPYSPM